MTAERLRMGPVMNHEITRELNILKYTGRIPDVRKKLRLQGFDGAERKVRNGVHEYRIVIPMQETGQRTATSIRSNQKDGVPVIPVTK